MTTTEAKAGRKEWIGLAVLILPVLLVAMDITVLYFAVPSISADLQPSGTQQLWMMDVYGFVLAGLLITMGGLGDRIGRRKLLIIGTVLFGAASVACAFSTSPEMLIASRALQGIGGATLMPSTLGLIRNMFHDPKQRRKAVAVWSVGLSAGAGLGPVVSGLMLSSFHWGSIFLVNIPIMVLLLVLAPVLIPEYRSPNLGKFDLLGGALSLTAVLSIIWGLKEIAVHHTYAIPGAVIAVGLILGTFFIRRQATHSDPMIDLTLFRNRGFGPSITCNLVCFFGMIGFGIFSTQYLMEVLRMKPLEAALWTLAAPVIVSFVAPIAAIVAQKTRPAYIIAAGFAVAASGFLLITQVTTEHNIPLVITAIVLSGVGIAVVLSIVTDMVVATAPAERAGGVSALLQTAQELGGALGIAVLGSIGAGFFGPAMDKTIPAGLPEGTLEAARQTLGGAHDVALKLPQAQGDNLFRVAQEAFVTAMHPAAITAAVVVLSAAVAALIFLRHIKNTPEVSAEDAYSVENTTETKDLVTA
ncbi:MFS transporter [Amycolatopsis sp. cg5]|uniref:MFS transporter n=1 Tax=Amycolatopsis sp. cg5 TaxID=3238802 RepID=UPI0035241BA8